MQSPRLLIVGAGKLGLPLAQTCAAGQPVLLLSRKPRPAKPNIQPLQADVTDEKSLSSLPPSLEVVVYCVTPAAHAEQAYRAVFVEGLNNLLQALHRPALKRVIFVSSTSVYHQNDGSWVDEDSPTQPKSFSGQCLLEAEQLLRQSGVPSTVVRFSGIYGGHRTRLLEQIMAGEMKAEASSPFTNRIHEQDCLGVLEHLVEKALGGESLADCYLASDCEPVRMGELVEWVYSRAGGVRAGANAARPPRRAGSKRCCNRRLLESGYRFRYPSFRDGYEEMLVTMSREEQG